jgi:hypothetical protein
MQYRITDVYNSVWIYIYISIYQGPPSPPNTTCCAALEYCCSTNRRAARYYTARPYNTIMGYANCFAANGDSTETLRRRPIHYSLVETVTCYAKNLLRARLEVSSLKKRLVIITCCGKQGYHNHPPRPATISVEESKDQR